MVNFDFEKGQVWVASNNQPKERWARYFWNLAHVVAGNSQCLSVKIGAVIVRDKLVLSTGYNGPPRGIPRCEDRWGIDPSLDRYTKRDAFNPAPTIPTAECPRRLLNFRSGEALHLCPSAHAEANAIISAARQGHSINGATMYVTCGTPCKDCLGLIINSGIVQVVCASTHSYDELSSFLLSHSDLKVTTYT